MSSNVTGHTQMLCVLGTPISHSISPQMHNEACALLGLDYEYLAFDIGTDNLKTVTDALRVMNVRGFNLTMPNKNLMAQLCDKLSPASEIAGAVNTVVNDNGVFTGYTTDGVGFMQSARAAGCPLEGKRAVILGAGGAGVPIIIQAAIDGTKSIDVFKRKNASWDKTQALVDMVNARTSCTVRLLDIADKTQLKESMKNAEVLVNTTSVGMSPNDEDCLIPDASYFHKGLAVGDIIYNPRVTKLMKMAQSEGCKTFNGLYMLLYQGAESFRLWTGIEMPIEPIKQKYFSE
jgi:quinate/shikimate dehydrogenase